MRGARFTVIIPAFNAARTIGSAIRSVLAQTTQDFELIVIDDGSKDETTRRACEFESDARIRVITQTNRGPSAARNAGIAIANGTYVSMLDADDLWLPEYLEVMGGTLDAVPDAAFAYTDAWLLDEATGRIRRKSAMAYQRPPEKVPDAGTFFLLLLERNFIYTSVTVRRSLLEHVGRYDESLWAGEDWELWLRLVALGAPVLRPPGLLAIHRAHGGSLTSDPRKTIQSACEIYRRIAGDSTAEKHVRSVALKQLEHWRATLERLDKPTILSRLHARGVAMRDRLLDRWLWHDRRPPAVERTLRAVAEID